MADRKDVQIIDIDMRGQVCPATLLVAMDKLNRFRKGLLDGTIRLLIKTDNRDATNTIPATAQNMGYGVRVRKEQSHYEIEIGLALSQEGAP